MVIVEVPVATRQKSQLRDAKWGSFSIFSTRNDPPAVFDEPLGLVLPRALVLLTLWVIWTFTWTGITWAFLSDLQVIDTPLRTNVKLNFWDYWYFATLNTVNLGTNDINPIGTSGRIWLAIQILFTISFLYALISVL